MKINAENLPKFEWVRIEEIHKEGDYFYYDNHICRCVQYVNEILEYYSGEEYYVCTSISGDKVFSLDAEVMVIKVKIHENVEVSL